MKYLKIFEDWDDEDEEEDDDIIARIDNSTKRGYHVVVFKLDRDDNEILVDDIPEIYIPNNSFRDLHGVMIYFDNIIDKYPQITKCENFIKNQKRSLLD